MTDLTTTGGAGGAAGDEETSAAAAADAALVERILAGDTEAMADLYDRYADRIHTTCVHMLRDEHEASDVTAQVLLTALQRIHQLRDPSKLKAWLFAIARNEVYKRSRQRSRVRPTSEVDDMNSLAIDLSEDDAVADTDSTVDRAALAALIQTAAAGLDERDRMVLELNLTQGLDGADLADALGVKVDNAYQLTHRMKERLERSLSALLVVQAGRDLCPDLDGVAKKWDGNYDVLWRKRFARHVDRCERCQRMRSKLPKAVLAGTALSQAAQSAVLAAPISVREQVLSQGPSIVATETGSPWSPDGFPRSTGRRRWPMALAAGVIVLGMLGVAGSLHDGLLDENPAGDEPTGTTTSTTSSTTTAPTTVSTTPADAPVTTSAPTTPARPTTVPPRVTTTTTTTTTTTPTTTTTVATEPPTRTPPVSSTTTTTASVTPGGGGKGGLGGSGGGPTDLGG